MDEIGYTPIMAIAIDVRADIKGATRHLNRVQRKIIPRITASALNDTARAHRNLGLKQVAKDIKLPQKLVTGRFDKNGIKKADRATVEKASKFKLTATISVYSRGIPVIQAVTRAQKVRSSIRARTGGVKAQGGRTYRRAFIAEAKGGNVQVFVRKGKGRFPLGVPRIGVRKRIIAAYEKSINTTGIKTFRKRFKSKLAFALSKAR